MVFPGVRRCHGDPRLCCKTPLGFRTKPKYFNDLCELDFSASQCSPDLGGEGTCTCVAFLRHVAQCNSGVLQGGASGAGGGVLSCGKLFPGVLFVLGKEVRYWEKGSGTNS